MSPTPERIVPNWPEFRKSASYYFSTPLSVVEVASIIAVTRVNKPSVLPSTIWTD